MATPCTFPLSRSAFTASAVVAISILVFTSFCPGDTNVPTSSAAQQCELTDGADTMVAMQGDINVKSGPNGMCSSNSRSTTCRGTKGSDTTVAMQSRLNLELGEDEDDAESDSIAASQSRLHLDKGDEDEDEEGAADGQEGVSHPMSTVETHPMSTVEGHAESLRSGLQEEKEEVVKSHENGPSSLLEEAETEVVADDNADDELLSTNAALSYITENRSSVDSDNARVSSGVNISAKEKTKVADASAPSAEASSLADFAENENKTSKTGGTAEHGKFNTSSANASGQDVMMQEEEQQQGLARLVQGAKTFVGAHQSLAIGLMIFLFMCACLAGMTIAYPSLMQSVGDSRTSASQRPTPGTEQREAMMERRPPSSSANFSNLPARASSASILAPWPSQTRNADHQSGHASGHNSRPSSKLSLPTSGPLGGVSLSKPGSQASVGAVSMSRAVSQLFMSQPGSQVSMSMTQDVPSNIRMTGSSSSLWARPSAHSNPEQEEELPPGVLPPPLCPMLVISTCESHFGVPMFELAQVNGEGEVKIVGLSGAPLLRCIVRQIGHLRCLEICMNEAKSVPRATITPSMMELSGSAPRGKGANALEIRGMNGAFYGTLEMNSHMDGGTCCVVKDGEIVLRVDGNGENLRLAIKSGNGTRLASVCCSSEAFGDIDHIEIRVRKGVDTVLVLAVVLAVLLLSPYLDAPTPRTSQCISDAG